METDLLQVWSFPNGLSRWKQEGELWEQEEKKKKKKEEIKKLSLCYERERRTTPIYFNPNCSYLKYYFI